MYHDLYLGGKVVVERKNVGFDLTKSDLCPSFVEDLTSMGVGLPVVDSYIGNHHEDGFTPLETIRRFLCISGSKSYSESKGIPSSRRGGPKIKSLVDFLSTDLPTTYKGLMETTYIWIKAKEMATNRSPNDHI
nr:hypothetical protein [Tanacetum cinerariifolium]